MTGHARSRTLLLAVSIAGAGLGGCGSPSPPPPASSPSGSGSPIATSSGSTASAGASSSGAGVLSSAGAATGSSSGGVASTGAAGTPSGSTQSAPPTADGGSASACPPSWTTTATCGGVPSGKTPDFGPKVLVFDPTMSMSSIQSQLDNVYTEQDAAQFGTDRYAYFFKPGAYALDVQVGFYTEAVGLGQSPDDVAITGAVRAKADWLGGGNATCNFWRGADNLSVIPSPSIDGGTSVWAVSQGTHLRRMHYHGSVALFDGGWASGGFVADSVWGGSMNSGSQQQFLTRNDDGAWRGANWNMVFVGDGNPPKASWPNPPYTVEATTPLVREKPFFYVDASGNYFVMVPALNASTSGHTWASGSPPGSPVSIDTFYIAKPDTDTAATMNAALAQGKNLLLTPGIYNLEASLQVSNPGTLVIGLGLATLIPSGATPVLQVADVDGVTLSDLLIEAGTTSSPTLVEIGPPGSSADHSASPTSTFDMHCRVGGADVGTASVCVTVNSSNVIIDNSWLWRADHGAGAAWNVNMADSGLVVNGRDVTAYGLFVEHFQKYQTVWNGNGGSVYFYQSEMPYDPPDQMSWMSSATENGYPSYKVASGVTSHKGEGLGVYSVFDNDILADNAFETGAGAGLSMSHMVTVNLSSGGISSILNGTGGAVGDNGSMMAFSSK